MIAFSSAQNPFVKQWDYRYGGTSKDVLTCLRQTADGGYILGGYSYSDSSGDKTQMSWGNADYWIVKTDSPGNIQWDRRYGGTSSDYLYSLQQTADGGYILGGYSSSGISGDKTQACWGGNSDDYWIVKIDSLGNKQWDKDFGGILSDELYSVQQTADGGYMLGGLSGSPISGDKTQPFWGGSDYWILKTDSLGNKQWDKDLGGTFNDRLFSLQQTTDGGYILGGYSFSGISGDKTEPNWSLSGTTADYWIIKIDSLGTKLWDKDFGGTNEDHLYSLQQTSDGGFILGGYSKSGDGNNTQGSWGQEDYWILKTDSLGNKQWDKDFGGTAHEDDFGNVTQTTDGGYLLAGTSYSDTIIGNKTENNLGGEQTWIVKTDSLGNFQWDKTIFTIGHDETGLAIQTNDGCIAVANNTYGGIGGYKTQPNWDTTNITEDYWIVKFCDSTLTTSNPTQSALGGEGVAVYPNPAGESLVISDKGTGKKEIEIYDVLGRTVLKSEVRSRKSVTKDSFGETTINISSLSPGIYFLKAGNEVRKFVKE